MICLFKLYEDVFVEVSLLFVNRPKSYEPLRYFAGLTRRNGHAEQQAAGRSPDHVRTRARISLVNSESI